MGCNSSKDSQPHQPRPEDISIELDVRRNVRLLIRETTDNTELVIEGIRDNKTRAPDRTSQSGPLLGC